MYGSPELPVPKTSAVQTRTIPATFTRSDFERLFQEREVKGSVIADTDDSTPESVMRIEDLSAGFNQSTAIEDISLSFPRNRITAIIGPSGCGKTTLLRCLNRMHEIPKQIPGPYPRYTAPWVKGIVYLGEYNIYEQRERVYGDYLRQQVGMVLQAPTPFPTMNIADNVLTGVRFGVSKKSKQEYPEIVERSLKQASLWDEVKDMLRAPGTSLSGGQQQRLCIARALAVEPQVLLMDEPCAALDPPNTSRIEELLTILKEEMTIVIVTHNLQQAARISDYAVLLCKPDGAGEDDPARIIEYGRSREFFVNPREDQTEGFITGRFG